MGTRYSTPPDPPSHTPPRVHLRLTEQCCTHGYTGARGVRLTKYCRGLKSVAQLSLSVHFSDIRGITEVYNLDILGNPDDHYVIPGND